MTLNMSWPGKALELFAAAETATGQVPPAFPLDAAVAVNPWLGQMAETRSSAAARMARVGGGRMFVPRETVAAMIADGEVTQEDLAAAASAHGIDPATLRRAAEEPSEPLQPLPTVAELVSAASGVDWPAFIEDRVSLWAAGHFDRGQAFWPAPHMTVWRSWRAFASRDLTPDLAGIDGFAARVSEMPPEARMAFFEACTALGLTSDAAPVYLHRLLATLGGWAQYARHIDWSAERDGERQNTLFDLLTVRLTFEVALLELGGAAIAQDWHAAQADYAAAITPDAGTRIDAALQDACDHSAERELAERLSQDTDAAAEGDAEIQAAFCIDVRSEPFRRALETADPGVRTLGFAGFFGLAVRHRGHASDLTEMRAPILLSPAVASATRTDDMADRIHLRAIRAWGRFKRAAVSAFAFVEAVGPLYVGKLLRDSLGRASAPSNDPCPVLDLPLADRIDAAEGILRAMSLTTGFARLVLICGHGATVTNAPHASALQCGACGGHAGDVNARLLAALLNEDAVREGLAARGVRIPEQALFVAGLHDTVSDAVRLFAEDVPDSHAKDLDRLRVALARAGVVARTARAGTLPRGAAENLAARGRDWSELRPEWGLAGCAGFIAAPRHRSAGRDLGGRVFLHDYDWQRDPDAAILEQILSAPVVVASWIALQYHGSTVAPETFGAGNKLLHNVVGGIGVLEGNGGALRAGLPMQSVHDGDRARHVPSRLVVAVEAPEERISMVLERRPDVRALFDNDWLTLTAMDDRGALTRRYTRGGWTDRAVAALRCVQAA
ncbi:YbcC family protein [Primorskyibacter sp. 2E107]|uniref:YbcC family protein n=1 Tax=Primorskyibacter sp. 2E107 TaxID=3403458 RepID=UPI003AF9F9CB